MRKIIIAIDGPAASGKSTAAKLLAKKLGYLYIDTGAMYRACALAALRQNVDIKNDNELIKLMNSIKVEIQQSNSGNIIILNGEDVSQEIREPDISRRASAISAKRVVREKMVELQRTIGEKGGVILDGRDIGTIVFPHAELKFFMVAPIEIRAQRRYLELKAKGLNPNFEIVLEELQDRDLADSSRALAPLIPASDAISIDNGSLSIEEQVGVLYSYYQKQMEGL
ncbi:MAG: (d)CMP kinase [Candidatus Cloacimonetes bacterium]|nr:(d)CMP kinase [Candidatus Cloacimonadota bacterium]